jgi:ATP-dependent DNA ligase
MLSRPRTLPTGFIAPCLPTKAPRPPSGALWLHEIKHDGFRVIARKDGARVKPRPRAQNSRRLQALCLRAGADLGR